MSRRLLFAVPVVLQVFCLNATACPGELGWAKWIWNEIEWTYSGTLSGTDIQAGANSWNNLIGYRITVNPSCSLLGEGDPCFDDIVMSDDSGLDGDILAQTDPIINQSSDSYCYDTYDTNGVCLNSSVAFYATMEWNPSALTADASEQSVTLDWDVQVTAAHELGHVLDLDDDDGASTCYSPTIMNYDDPYPDVCNFTGPQTCDVSEMLSAYASWTTYTWSPGECTGSCN